MVTVAFPGQAGQVRRLGASATRLRALVLLAPLLFLVICQPFTTPTDPDYWWHVRTGQLIAETGTIPRTDPFSYTAAGQPWVTHEWGTELLFYVVSHALGYAGLVAFFGIVEALTALAVYLMCRRRGLGEPAAAIFMMLAFGMSLTNATVRPQVLTAFLLAVCAWLLTRYRQGERRALWPLPIIFVLWVNLHGGYLIGFGLLGLTILGEIIAARRSRPAAPVVPLVVATAISVLTTLINPHGFQAWTYPFTFLGSANPVLGLITEWQSPNFHDPLFLPFAASLLLAIYLGIGGRPIEPTEIVWVIAFAILGLEGVRNIPLYAVVAVPILGARLQAEFSVLRYSLVSWRRPLLLVAAALAVTFVALSPLLSPTRRAHLQLGVEPNTTGFPVGAVEYLRTHDLRGNLFNEYDWGGYIIDRLYPTRRVFIDSRPDMYGVTVTRDYLTVAQAAPGWRDVLDRYGVSLALVRTGSPIAVMLSSDPDWHVIYRGSEGVLFAAR